MPENVLIVIPPAFMPTGYIVFVFPFVHSYVCSFIRSLVPSLVTFCVKVLVKVSLVVYISYTNGQKQFVFAP